LLGTQTDDKFFVMFEPFRDGLIALFDALKLHEAGDFSHDISCDDALRLDC
jgi:hypothetical protein